MSKNESSKKNSTRPVVTECIKEFPIIQQVENVTEVLDPQYLTRWVPKPCYDIVERIIEVPKPTLEEKIIEVPEIEFVEEFVEIPQYVYKEKLIEVPRVILQERIIPIPKHIVEEKVIEKSPFEMNQMFALEFPVNNQIIVTPPPIPIQPLSFKSPAVQKENIFQEPVPSHKTSPLPQQPLFQQPLIQQPPPYFPQFPPYYCQQPSIQQTTPSYVEESHIYEPQPLLMSQPVSPQTNFQQQHIPPHGGVKPVYSNEASPHPFYAPQEYIPANQFPPPPPCVYTPTIPTQVAPAYPVSYSNIKPPYYALPNYPVPQSYCMPLITDPVVLPFPHPVSSKITRRKKKN